MPQARTDWSATIRLPKTDFPMKGDLAKREPELLKVWEDEGLYQKMQQRQKGRPPFVLHDGPPYANGSIHIGHAMVRTPLVPSANVEFTSTLPLGNSVYGVP